MLTFLNSYLLPALSLAALPILIHLLTRHKVREQEFSDLRFLEEIHRKKMRRMRLRQWILLILRTLALLFIIAAFTRPAIRGVDWGNIGAHEQTTVAILVDNSYSTGAIRESADIFTYEKATANKILSLLKENDAAAVAVFNENTRWLTPKPSRFFDNLSAMLDTVSISDYGTNIAQAVESADKMLQKYHTIHREIYILTDNTAIGWRKGTFPKIDDADVYALAFSTDRVNNRTISDITFPSQLLEVGKPFDLSVSVKNNSQKAVRGILVSLIVDGQKTSQSEIDLPAGAQVVTELSGQVLKGGFHWGYAQCSEDNLAADNRRYFSFRIPEKLDVLIIGESQMRKFIRLALSPESDSKFFHIAERTESQVGQEIFEKYDVIVLIDPYSLSESSIQRMRAFVSNGGGIFIIPGERDAENPGTYQNILRNFGDITVIGAIGDTTKISQLGWGKSEFAHPVLSVFEKTGLPDATFRRIIQFDIKDGRVFLRFENNMPALAETPLGDGRIIISGFSTDLRWGNIVLSGAFVPIVHRICQHLASDVAYFDAELCVGDKAARTLTQYSGSGKLQVSYPGGNKIFVLPRFVGGKAMTFLDNLPNAGIYSISSDNDTLDLFCANIDAAEGDLTPLNHSEKKKYPVHWLDADKDISEQILTARYGIELWRPLLILALLLLALEMIIETNWKKRT